MSDAPTYGGPLSRVVQQIHDSLIVEVDPAAFADAKVLAPPDAAASPLPGFTWAELRAGLRAAGRLHGPRRRPHGGNPDGWEVCALDLLGNPVSPGDAVHGVPGPRDAVRVSRDCAAVGDAGSPWGGLQQVSSDATWHRGAVAELFDPGVLPAPQDWPHVVELESGEVWTHPELPDGSPDVQHPDAFAWSVAGKETIAVPVSAWRIDVGGETIVVPDEFALCCVCELAHAADVMLWMAEQHAPPHEPGRTRSMLYMLAGVSVPVRVQGGTAARGLGFENPPYSLTRGESLVLGGNGPLVIPPEDRGPVCEPIELSGIPLTLTFADKEQDDDSEQ